MSPDFEGHEPRDCGEHRTVGPHRAWCYECIEWCYPRLDAACTRCELPTLRERLAQSEAAIARVRVAIVGVDLPCARRVRAALDGETS